MEKSEQEGRGSHQSADRPLEPGTPKTPRERRNTQLCRLVLAATTISLLVVVLLVATSCSRLGTAPPASSDQLTATANAAPGYPTATAIAAAFQQLEQRPLHLPMLAPGANCPNQAAVRLPYDYATYGPALGQGPVFALGFNMDGTLDVGTGTSSVNRTPTTWTFSKVQWVSTSEFRGPAIVRGQQLDGSHALRFNGGIEEEYTSDLAASPLRPELHLVFSGPPIDVWPRLHPSASARVLCHAGGWPDV